MQVSWQVCQEPAMLLDFIERYPFDRVGLQHALDEIFHIGWNLPRHVVISLLDLREQKL